MLELLLFLGGAGVGALAALLCLLKHRPKEKDAPQGEESAYMQTQYANFFNYDGTSKGQLPLE